jgi:mediator of RNA polymerase II transcription subunit 21
MLQELSHMDRITQLQDEIQHLLTIMGSTVAYLTSRANFVQVSEEVPVTKERNPDKYDKPEVFEGQFLAYSRLWTRFWGLFRVKTRR